MFGKTLFPGFYIQGDGAVKHLGPEIEKRGESAFVLGDPFAVENLLPSFKAEMEKTARLMVGPLGGECSDEEIGRLGGSDLAHLSYRHGTIPPSPPQKVPPRHAALGGVFAAVFLEAAKHGVSLFMAAKIARLGTIYGSLTVIITLPVWLVYSFSIFLVGAELVWHLGARRKSWKIK
jgi:hypothetical protein